MRSRLGGPAGLLSDTRRSSCKEPPMSAQPSPPRQRRHRQDRPRSAKRHAVHPVAKALLAATSHSAPTASSRSGAARAASRGRRRWPSSRPPDGAGSGPRGVTPIGSVICGRPATQRSPVAGRKSRSRPSWTRRADPFFRDTLGPVARRIPFGVTFVRVIDGVDLDDPWPRPRGGASSSSTRFPDPGPRTDPARRAVPGRRSRHRPKPRRLAVLHRRLSIHLHPGGIERSRAHEERRRHVDVPFPPPPRRIHGARPAGSRHDRRSRLGDRRRRRQPAGHRRPIGQPSAVVDQRLPRQPRAPAGSSGRITPRRPGRCRWRHLPRDPPQATPRGAPELDHRLGRRQHRGAAR